MADELDESPPLRCEVETKPDVTVLTVSGEIDMDTAADLTEAMTRALTHSKHLVVDLADVSFIDSTGLRSLVDIHIEASRTDREVKLAVGNGQARRPIEISGLNQVLSVYESVESAVAG
jgi:anti-sigma B factor antagonist